MSKTNARSKKVCYYATNVPNKFIEVSVGYTKGMNYFTYETYNGYKLAMQPMELNSRNGYTTSTYMLFSGLGLKVEPADRFNAKRLAKIAELAETLPDYAGCLAQVAAKHGLTVGAKLTEKEAWEAAEKAATAGAA